MITLKNVVLKYANVLIFEETPNGLISFFKRSIFNKPILDKNSDFSTLGGNAIKERIASAKKYKDTHLRDDKGGTITKNEFLELVENTPQYILNVINKYLENYNSNGELIV